MNVLRPNFKSRDGSPPLVDVIVQNELNGDILMLGTTDEAGYIETLTTGFAVFWSKSRKERWKKGETTGDTIQVNAVFIDCDGDALIYRATTDTGSVCHTKAYSCFFRMVTKPQDFLHSAPKFEKKEELSNMDISVHKNFFCNSD